MYMVCHVDKYKITFKKERNLHILLVRFVNSGQTRKLKSKALFLNLCETATR